MILNRRVSLRKTLSNLDLSEAEDILKTVYKYSPGKPGKPPISPTGMFLSFILMFLRTESYRDYHAFLEKERIVEALNNPNKTVDFGLAPAEPLILKDIMYDFKFGYNKTQMDKLDSIEQKIVTSLLE